MALRDFNNINEIRKTQMLLSDESDPARIADALDGRNTPWNQNIKAAILAAQAAERACQLADKAGTYARKHEGCVEQYSRLNKGRPHSQREFIKDGAIEYNDAFYNSLGAEIDPEILRQARALQMAAQIYMNNETLSIKEEITLKDFLGRTRTMGPEYADGLKRSAGDLYIRAAEILAREGLAEAAAKLAAAGCAVLKYKVDNKDAPGPSQFLQKLLFQQQYDLQAANISAGGEYHSLDKKYEDTMQKLIALTAPPLPKTDAGPKP